MNISLIFTKDEYKSLVGCLRINIGNIVKCKSKLFDMAFESDKRCITKNELFELHEELIGEINAIKHLIDKYLKC